MEGMNGASPTGMPAYECVFTEGDPALRGPQETIALTVDDLEALFLYEWYRGCASERFAPFAPIVTFGMPQACLEGFRAYQVQRADGIIPETGKRKGNWGLWLGIAAALLLFFGMTALAMAVIPDDIGTAFR